MIIYKYAIGLYNPCETGKWTGEHEENYKMCTKEGGLGSLD